MPTYQVQWKYSSGLGGPWEKGELVELEEWRANHINVDSPGVLKAVEGSKLKVEGEKTVKSGKKGKDRQIKAAQNRQIVMGRDQPGYGLELLPNKEE